MTFASALLLLSALTAPADAALARPAVSTGPVIAAVRVERWNVFDPRVPGENWWLFRMANRIHILTRENVVRREMLLSPGDRWDSLKILESERNLRSNGSFRRAEIVQLPRSDGRITALMRTQDSWTTNVRLDIGTEGGESYYAYGFEENNFLGYGKTVSMSRSADSKSNSTSVGYSDPRFLGTRLRLGTNYSHGTGGDSHSLSLAQPFYSLEADKAVSAAWSQSHGAGTTVYDAVEISQYRVFSRVVDASYGRRLSRDRLFVQRAEVGWYADKRSFDPTEMTAPDSLPFNRENSGPTVGYSWVQPRYIKETYIEGMERIEDFNLGNELRLRAGWMGTRTGSDRDRVLFDVADQQGYDIEPGRFILGSVNVTGRAANGKWENGLISGAVNLFWKTTWVRREHTVVAHLEGAVGRFLDRDAVIALGGNSGLRGYKNYAFTGGKSILANIEDRFFLDGEWFHLLRLGGVVFAESGCVVPEGSGFSLPRFKSDVGAGLRISPTRSRGGTVVRVDMAYALNHGPGGSRWVLSAVAGQAFSFGSSAASHVQRSPSSRL